MLDNESLRTNVDTGLTQEEARQRLREQGPNRFNEAKKTSFVRLIWDQINSVLIYILIAAAVISAIVGEISDAVIIGLVIVLNAVIGVVQESKAEKALQELKKMSTPKAIVKRDGSFQEIPSEEVVVGDLISLNAGRYVPADVRLVETSQLKIEESSLTGESTAVDKDSAWESEAEAPIGDQKNMAFM